MLDNNFSEAKTIMTDERNFSSLSKTYTPMLAIGNSGRIASTNVNHIFVQNHQADDFKIDPFDPDMPLTNKPFKQGKKLQVLGAFPLDRYPMMTTDPVDLPVFK